jgi:hypothetical protein
MVMQRRGIFDDAKRVLATMREIEEKNRIRVNRNSGEDK